MPFNAEVTAQRQALPKPEILAYPLETNVIDSCVLDATKVAADAAGPYRGRLYLLAGTILSKREDGLYEEYRGVGALSDVDEVQRIVVDATGGNWTITFDGEETANISATANAAAVKAALEALSNLDTADVTVTGGPGNSGGDTPYVLTFGGAYADQDVPQVQVTNVSLTGGGATVSVGTTTQGSEETDAQAIAGVLFETVEFADNTPASREPAAFLRRGVSFEKSKIVNFADHSVALLAWAEANNCEFIEGGVN